MDIQMKCMSVTVRSLFIIRMLYIVVLMFLIIQIKFISVSYDHLRFFFFLLCTSVCPCFFNHFVYCSNSTIGFICSA